MQKACFDKVMLLAHEIGFNVIEICVDNASANKKFFKDFFVMVHGKHPLQTGVQIEKSF